MNQNWSLVNDTLVNGCWMDANGLNEWCGMNCVNDWSMMNEWSGMHNWNSKLVIKKRMKKGL